MKSFRLWLELKDHSKVEEIKRKLLSNLGFNEKSDGPLDNKLDEKDIEDYELALGAMGLSSDKVSELMNFVRNNFAGSTIKDLLNQIEELDIPEEEEPVAPSRQAKIPPGQFIPKPQPQQPNMQQPQMGGL